MRVHELAHQRRFVQELGARRFAALRVAEDADVNDFYRDVISGECVGRKVNRA